jgi:hypothetical protein
LGAKRRLNKFETIGDFDKILSGGDGIEDDLDSVLLNPVASTIPKWWTFKPELGTTFELIGGFG